MMTAVLRMLLLALFSAGLLAGCGQKGPLFLAGEAPESQTQGPFGLDQKSQDISQPAPSERRSDGAGDRDDDDSP